MSRRDPTVCISQMLDHAREAREMVRGCSRADLDTNRMLNLAPVRLMEVAGEAATRIPQEFQSRYPQIPWRRITGLRNRLAHGHDTVDFDILTSTFSLRHSHFDILTSIFCGTSFRMNFRR